MATFIEAARGWTSRRPMTSLATIALFFAGAFAVVQLLPCPLPKPKPFEGSMPSASPPVGMSITELRTGVTHRSAAFAYRGGSFFDKRDFSMSALLVHHPRGDLLIDTGFGRDIARQLQLMPAYFRAVTSYTRTKSAAEQLDEQHYDRKQLRGVLLTHAHWDHVSGLGELEPTPVLIDAEERKFIDDGGFLTAVARSIPGVKYETYELEGGQYLGFPKSHDMYGDGSIVVVPAPGHTPGSGLLFLTRTGDRHVAMVGDLVWQRDAVTLREERPFFQRTLGDADQAGVRENILRIAAIAERFPAMKIVPAHDARAFDELR